MKDSILDQPRSTFQPHLTFWQIWNMNFGFLGIQFGFALQNANTSRIFSTLGASADELPALWLAAPVTGLLVQPIIGYYSDRTWSPRWGRRRPYFAIGAMLASLALFLMPNSPALWVAAGVLWMLDASINVSMEPFRALVGDMLPPAQRTSGFAMQSFFIGTGAVVASVMPWVFTNWLHIDNVGEDGMIADSVKYSYFIGAAVLFISVMWTVFRTKEYPPSSADEQHLKAPREKISEEGYFLRKFNLTAISLLSLGILVSASVYYFSLSREVYVLGGGLILFAIIHFIAAALTGAGKSDKGLVHMVRDFHMMPRTMIQLAYVQFFSWFALFSMWIYTTDAVTSFHFHTSDASNPAYGEGSNLVGTLFGLYNAVAALAAFLLPVLSRYTSRRVTHFIALSCGGLGLISFYLIGDPSLLWITMIGVGIAWCSILSIPYAMLSGALPPSKMGYYMGIFNFFIVIPQIIAAALLGSMLTYLFNGQSIYILVSGGVAMFIAGLLSLRIRDEQQVTVG